MRDIFLTLLCFSALTFVGQEPTAIAPLSDQGDLYEQDFLSADFHMKRRAELRKLMPKNSAVIFFSNPVRNRSNDVDFEFHQDPDFYYLSGFTEPNSILVVFAEPQKVNGIMTSEVIYVPRKEPSKELWNGNRMGDSVAKLQLGIESVYNNTEFRNQDLRLENLSLVSYSMNTESLADNPFDKEDLYNLRRQFQAKLFEADDKNVKKEQYTVWMGKLREVKTPEELVLLRKAIDITCDAQKELMKAITPNMTEYQSEAIVEFIFKLSGAEYPGFPSIQGSGQNSCVLHYQSNRKRMLGKNLLVSDVGAEYHGYTADVTRTIPVDGTFSPEEKIIYELVLEAQNAGIEAAQEGANFWASNTAATTTLSQGLLKLGIIRTPLELKRYFMHGTSHYLGLDVHDAGTYGKLKINTVITVEPGIYIAEGSPCDPKWWNIGVRIEDDILITKDGPVNLSGSLPRSVAEIEALMKETSYLNQ
jgi:Xaa-Pro aminopeptidase